MKEDLQILEKSLTLMPPNDEEVEPYVLSSDEESAAICHAIQKAKDYYQWRQMDKKMKLYDVENRMLAIDWDSQIDKKEILAVANANKNQYIFHEQQKIKTANERIARQKELQKKCDANYMFSVMASYSRTHFGKRLFVSDHNTKLISALCFFFSKDVRFEKEFGYDFKKGLWIRGISGLGKTYLVKCISQNEIKPVTVLNLIDITESIKNDDDYQLPHFKSLYLDDVGTEELDSKRYGSKISFFKNFIELQSLRHTDFSHLLVSTNCDFKMIEERYGFRVRSRVREMFNVIDIKGEDLRGKNLEK